MQSTHGFGPLRTSAIVAILAVVGVGTALTDQPRSNGASPLFKDSRQAIAIARAQGRTEVVLLVAAREGAVAAVAKEVDRLGGNVRYQAEDVGYVRASVPIDRASLLADHAGIESIAMDRDDTYPGRLLPTDDGDDAPAGRARLPLASQAAQAEKWPPSWGDYPLRRPYSPLADIDAAELLGAHPTYDGRGVTIAVLDGNLDLLLPEFQTAYTLEGQPVPKIADFLNATDPLVDGDAMPQWVNMNTGVIAEGGTTTFRGRTFTVPRDGSYRIGLFDERRFNDPGNAAYIDQDIDRNGNPKGDDGLFGVLWDESANDVWVDTDRDLSFADEAAMTDYSVRQDIGVFGSDDPATPVRDSIGFTVQTDRTNRFVSINVGIYQHATIILGSVTGNRVPNGRLHGVAPGARLISIMHHGIAHAMVEGLIAAFEHPLVDLIVLEQHVGVASLPYLLADGRHPISIVAQRLIQKHRKLLFVPGSNSPGFGIVAEDGLAPSAVSVGGYQSRESYRMNAGFISSEYDNLHWGALSHGPSGIGALKPDLLAPSGQMSTDPGYRDGEVRRGLFQLPPGYTVDGGTSTAAPMAAGAAALVMSAARQANVPVDGLSLKAALTSSARYIPRLGAHEQGSGLVQVAAAFERLRALASAPVVAITSRAPVRTRLSHLLSPPNEGTGLYERGGWAAGGRGTRTITFTRTSGPSGPMTFSVEWQGGGETFSSSASIVLPLDTPVEFPVTVHVKEPGAHSALLTLRHSSIPGHAHRVLNTVVAPIRLGEEKTRAITTDITVPRPGDRGIFVEIPPGAAALRLSAKAEDATVLLTAISPGREQMYPCGFTGPPDSCAIARPEPGVWEINATANAEARNFDATRPQPLEPLPVTLNAALLGFEVVPEPIAVSLVPGATAGVALSFANRLGALDAASVSTSLGSAFSVSRTIAAGEQQAFEIVVPKGATSLRARIGDVGVSGADLDLYLLDCTGRESPAAPAVEKEKGNKAPPVSPPRCAPRAKAATVDADGEVEIFNPAPGRWVAVVDAYHVPNGSTTYAYTDVFTHPGLGSLSVADAPDRRDAGATWTAAARVWAAGVPEAPRRLLGRAIVSSRDATALDGSPLTLGAADIELTTGETRRGGRQE